MICPKCKWLFPAESVWAWLQTTQRKRKHCPKCWADGPFPKATDQEIAAHEQSQREGWKAYVVLEVAFFILILIFIFAR